MPDKIIDKILAKIKSGDVKQAPKWRFQLKEFLVWFGAGVLIGAAALSFSAILFNFQDVDWELRPRLHLSVGRFLFMQLPYFWIIISFGLGALAYIALRHTKRGYHYALPAIIFIVLLLIFTIGWASHRSFTAGRFMERGAMRGLPYYNIMTRPRQIIWLNPDKGILAGKVVSPYLDNGFELSDIDSNIWQVRCNECFTHPMVVIKEDERVKVIGEKAGNFYFKASEIRPFFMPADFHNPVHNPVIEMRIRAR